jgi:hypothetical protein
MTSFAPVHYPTVHPGVARMERVSDNVKHAASHFDATRSGASLLLAAIVAALMVVANQVIDTWTEGHLLAAWIIMWALAFAGLALFAAPAKRAAISLRSGLRHWNAARRQAAQDRELWQLAQTDSRVMADLQCAIARG